MRGRRVGSSGLTVSRLALGTAAWGTVVDEETSRDLLTAFVGAGGSLVDTAHSYGYGASETFLGRMLGDVVPRDDVVLCTKAGVNLSPETRSVDTSRGSLLRHLDASLQRLRTATVDLWLVHCWDDGAPVEETMSALEYAVTSGRARYVGVSNYSGWQSARAFSILQQARVPLLVNEVDYSLLVRDVELEVAPAATALGFGLFVYSPLAGGVLTGKYRSGVPAGSRATMRQFPYFVRDRLDDHAHAVTDAVVTAADGLGATPTAVALAWVRDRPGVTAPIVGPRTVAQLRAALASEELELPEPIVAALEQVSD